ncbi:regulator component [Streptomyces marincola]|uniref:regulator component n=1 Tax=Streptomyces marincola TaxID=2878388 RepID=UPI001CF36EFC|nr:regulator component [Streptomyces marincola]UCM87983.1 regulator component [Streptomyces marincola]
MVLKELPEQAADAGACGLWVGTDEADFVFYEARTAPIHREHIILHEIAHMLVVHHRAPMGDSGSGKNGDVGGELRGLLDGLQPHLIKRLMQRTSYTTAEEREAEMLASLMRSGQKPRAAGALGRLGALLGVRGDDRF